MLLAFDQVKKLVQQVKTSVITTRLKPAVFHELAPAITQAEETASPASAAEGPLFDNPFNLADLEVFDEKTLKELFRKDSFGISLKELAQALHGTDQVLRRKVGRQMSYAR